MNVPKLFKMKKILENSTKAFLLLFKVGILPSLIRNLTVFAPKQEFDPSSADDGRMSPL